MIEEKKRLKRMCKSGKDIRSRWEGIVCCVVEEGNGNKRKRRMKVKYRIIILKEEN